MSDVTLSGQSLVTVEETLRYLQDQGSVADDNDLLRHHINGVTAFMLTVTGLDRFLWVDDDEITEYPSGGGADPLCIYLKNAPIRKIVSVTLEPHQDSSTSLTVPVEPSTYSDDMYFEPVSGLLVLKRHSWPEGPANSKVVYEAGYYKQDSPTSGDPADPQLLELKLIMLSAVASKWARWKNQKHGIDSETRGESSTSYSRDDFTNNELKNLKRHRRHLFA